MSSTKLGNYHNIRWGDKMKKKLPNVYVKAQSKKINNNKETYYSAEEENEFILRKKEETNEMLNNIVIKDKINNIFKSSGFVYKTKVRILLPEEEMTTYVIARNKDYIITFNNVHIRISDIKDIIIL